MTETSKPIRFGAWEFSGDFMRAVDPKRSKKVTFTRSERLLLEALAENPGRIMSRDRLLDLLSGIGSDVGDRSVDILINRVRRKLGDSARNPAYIATQYGEGYVWIAGRSAPRSDESGTGARIIVGPVLGLPPAGDNSKKGWDFLSALAEGLDLNTGNERKVAILRNGYRAEENAKLGRKVTISASFLTERSGELQVALTARRLDDQKTLWTRRVAVSASDKALADLARDIGDAIWTGFSAVDTATPAPDDSPLPVRMHEAATLLATTQSAWKESEGRMREALAKDPDNAENRIVLATALHTKLLTAGEHYLRKAPDWYDHAEEIEDLTLAALPDLQGNDVMLLQAAKLLWFANPRHRQLAMDIAEDVLATTTAITTAYTTVAQIRMWAGRSEEAIDLLDRALEIVPPDVSHLRFYLMTLKIIALNSLGDFEAGDAIASEICARDPLAIPRFSILFAPGGFDRDEVLRGIFDAMDIEAARGLLMFIHYMSTRHFIDPEARRLIMMRPARLLVDYFGDDVLIDEARRDLGGNLQSLAS